ncbi:MAG: RNA methyltransferase [Chloroflexi bacterium]|nr:RNA methyltransferase [Chloroflexota bacterium]
MTDPITSPHNPRVKLVRQLQRQAKTRRQQQRLVLEGVRLITDALDSGAVPDFLCFSGDASPVQETVTRASGDGILCLPVTEDLLRDMADTETPQGVLGVFPWPDLAYPDPPARVIVADGWRDPGNLGTMLRTAAAAGVDLVVLAPGTVDVFNPKCIRAGMGAQFRVPVRAWSWDKLQTHLADHHIFLAAAQGDQPYDTVDWPALCTIIVGSEAHGPSAHATALAYSTLYIPMQPGAESLNAAVAASLLIYASRRTG